MNRFKLKKYLPILFIAGICSLCSCRDDIQENGDGTLALRMSMAVPETSSKPDAATAESQVLADSCRVRIYGSKGLVRYYKGLDNMPSELLLAAGDYRIDAVSGDSVAATFKIGYYKGSSDNVNVKAGSTTTTTVVCKIVNTLVTVNFTDQLKEVLSNYEVTVASSAGSLVYTQQHVDSVGYFILPANETQLNWTITGESNDGKAYTQSGTLQNIKPATKYALTFNYNETEYTIGGAYFNLTVDESAIEEVENITIYKRPDITGDGFDITKPLAFEVNAGTETVILVDATSALSSLIVSGNQMQAMGLPENTIDLYSATEDVLSLWETAGLSYSYKYIENRDISNARIVFSETLMKSLAEGTYEITIHASDMQGKEWTETLVISVSNAMVLTQDPLRSDIWAHRATLRGQLLRQTSDPIVFQYKKSGESAWNNVEVTMGESDIFTAELTGLEAATTYQYRAVCGDIASTMIATFTTESEFVIPNAGFENWHQYDNVWLVYGEGEEMWWDTGNHGSSTMGINVTTQDSSIKNSGAYSIKMASQFVGLFGSIGKFAAGNVFAGSYVGTDGTNGILDFGRTISSRPSQLKGYYKYIAGEVDYSETDELPVGATDKGNIYIAIGDWTTPVRITTKDKNIFNKNDEHIIGFGEIVPDANTPGDGLIPFTIDIDYRAYDRIPTYIVIVASASYYGDFFTGSSSSVLWLDDLELVYE